MKTIRTRVSEEDYAEYKAEVRNERAARRALRRLKRQVKHGGRLYNLRGGGAVIVTPDWFYPSFPTPEGVGVTVHLAVHGVDAESAARLREIWQAARDAGEETSEAIRAVLPSAVARDVKALLDWASPRDTVLWRGPTAFFLPAFITPRQRRLATDLRRQRAKAV